jgi:hypothetical protein
MPVATAVERGAYINVYDERGSLICSVPAHNGLVGYTSSTVSVRQGAYVLVFNDRGQQISSAPAG